MILQCMIRMNRIRARTRGGVPASGTGLPATATAVRLNRLTRWSPRL